MKAGEFLAQGSDTCVYDPHLACITYTGSEFTQHRKLANHVSRVVPYTSQEIVMQQTLKRLIPNAYQKHFTFYTESCSNFVVRPQDSRNVDNEFCTLYKALEHRRDTVVITETYGLMNLVTPKLGRTLDVSRQTDLLKTQQGMSRFIKALLDLQGKYFVYFDGHDTNIAWNRQETEFTFFDFGWTKLTDEAYLSVCNAILSQAEYYRGFKQFVFGVLALQLAEKRVDFLRLKPIWDALSVLGTCYYDTEYNPQTKARSLVRHEIQLFPNVQECANELIDAVVVFGSSDASVFHDICDRTIFAEEPILDVPMLERGAPEYSQNCITT